MKKMQAETAKNAGSFSAPAPRIAFVSLALVVSLLLVGTVLVYNHARMDLAKALAAQIVVGAESEAMDIVEAMLASVADQHPGIVSIGLRDSRGGLLSRTEGHMSRWDPAQLSTFSTQYTVPVSKDGRPWTTLELRFRSWHRDPLLLLGLGLALLVGVMGCLGVVFFVRWSHGPGKNMRADPTGKESETPRRSSEENGTLETAQSTTNNSPFDSTVKILAGAASFNNVSELEANNAKLRRMLDLLEASQHKVKEQNRKLQYLATRDALTGCLNRRSFHPQIERLVDKALAAGTDLSCVMVDIDYFKAINDRFGHTMGDKAIKAVAYILRRSMRKGELVCRYGGEEFCVVLPTMSITKAYRVAERLRETIASRKLIEINGAPVKEVTASFGVTSLRHGGASNEADLIQQADEALYFAKTSGRNQVMQWSEQIKKGSEGAWVKTVSGESDATIAEEPLESGREMDFEASRDDSGEAPAMSEFIEDLRRQVAQTTDELERHKLHDALTGLPNRLMLNHRIERAMKQARASGRPFALIMLNINRFRRVNEWLGYSAGDDLLRHVGEHLSAVLRETDSVLRLPESSTVSRCSGDDFALLLTDLEDPDGVGVVADRLVQTFSSPVHLADHDIYVTCSMGISSFPMDGHSAEELIKRADLAMRSGKDAAGTSYQFYSEHMENRTSSDLRLESELRSAVAQQSLRLHYQPQVDLLDGRVASFEALLRWEHPDLGFISPSDFIPLAEYTGLIMPIGRQVLHDACTQAKAWEASHDAAGVRVAVNVSPVQLKQKDFMSTVIEILEATGLSPDCLELEITESTVMEDMDLAVQILGQLRELGIRTAIDDFGIGYSSLSYIRRFPVDTVKIDRSFIRDLDADVSSIAIVSAIINMAHELNLHVVAEGVETPEQAARLRDARCDYIQGYLFSRPLPPQLAQETLDVDARKHEWWPTGPRAFNRPPREAIS